MLMAWWPQALMDPKPIWQGARSNAQDDNCLPGDLRCLQCFSLRDYRLSFIFSTAPGRSDQCDRAVLWVWQRRRAPSCSSWAPPGRFSACVKARCPVRQATVSRSNENFSVCFLHAYCIFVLFLCVRHLRPKSRCLNLFSR